MRTICLAVGLLIFQSASIAGPREDAIQRFGSLLIEFEGAVKYSYQVDEWRGKRDAWIANVRNYTQDEFAEYAMAGLLEQCELSLRAEAFTSGWGARHDGWHEDVEWAEFIDEVADLLLELERNVVWDATEDSWKSRRDAWVAELSWIRDNGEYIYGEDYYW